MGFPMAYAKEPELRKGDFSLIVEAESLGVDSPNARYGEPPFPMDLQR